MRTIRKLLLGLAALCLTSFLVFAAPGDPASANAGVGKKVTITVVADGSAPLVYQWQKAANVTATPSDIAGATSASYVINTATLADSGVYSCKISNAFGSIVSPTATLTVGTAPTLGGTSISISVN